eukprot:m.129180 g.129180  ORF g.129180 m.129180 type:complete len:307 (-) comp22312_c0_seq3:1486-2406(-)
MGRLLLILGFRVRLEFVAVELDDHLRCGRHPRRPVQPKDDARPRAMVTQCHDLATPQRIVLSLSHWVWCACAARVELLQSTRPLLSVPGGAPRTRCRHHARVREPVRPVAASARRPRPQQPLPILFPKRNNAAVRPDVGAPGRLDRRPDVDADTDSGDEWFDAPRGPRCLARRPRQLPHGLQREFGSHQLQGWRAVRWARVVARRTRVVTADHPGVRHDCALRRQQHSDVGLRRTTPSGSRHRWRPSDPLFGPELRFQSHSRDHVLPSGGHGLCHDNPVTSHTRSGQHQLLSRVFTSGPPRPPLAH